MKFANWVEMADNVDKWYSFFKHDVKLSAFILRGGDLRVTVSWNVIWRWRQPTALNFCYVFTRQYCITSKKTAILMFTSIRMSDLRTRCTTVTQLISCSVTALAIMSAHYHSYRCAPIPICSDEATSRLAPARSGESYDLGSRGETGA